MVFIPVFKPKPKCIGCGKTIGRLDQARLKLMEKSMSINPQAKQEFEELKGHCPTCLTLIFQSRFTEAKEQLKQQLGDKFEQLPEKVKKILKRGEKST